MKKLIILLVNSFNYVINYITIKRKHVDYETFPLINGKIKIHGNGKIKLGKRVQINSSESSNPIGGMEHTILSVYENAILQIGDDTGISNCAIVSRIHVNIGSHVLIGGNVKIYDTDFHSLDYKNRMNYEADKGKALPISIGNNVFIGAHSIILKGVLIGNNSIIGAGSVVTNNVPENEIWAGNPAHYIKKIYI